MMRSDKSRSRWARRRTRARRKQREIKLAQRRCGIDLDRKARGE